MASDEREWPEWPHFFEEESGLPDRCFHDSELWPCWAERVRQERDAAVSARQEVERVLGDLRRAAKAVLDWEAKERWAGPHDVLAGLIGYYE